ncbi:MULTISPECIES: shufflon system plasmid conjugative transfer pilus tip adhesin PilV, partial [Burkholderiaceae]
MMGLRAVKKQGGFTALELLVVLIVTVAALGLGSQYLMSYADTQVNQAAADHNKTVADAATKYTKDNYAAILATATSSSPAVITVPMLKSTGYLTSSVTDQNPYGQTYEIRALQPVANKLETLIVTLGGETIPEMDLRRIAQVSGARGGYISSTNTAVATGSYGGWQMPLANYGTSPGAGHLATALFFDDGALVSDYLYRNAVAGHPEFNRMNTAIDMNGNNINNAGTVNATTLNATGDTYTGGWFRSQGDTGWYSQKWGGGWYMSDSNWIRSVNDKNVYTAGQMQAGTMRSNGRLSTGEYLQVDGVAVENQPCGARTVGLDANGLTLSCQSGVW